MRIYTRVNSKNTTKSQLRKFTSVTNSVLNQEVLSNWIRQDNLYRQLVVVYPRF